MILLMIGQGTHVYIRTCACVSRSMNIHHYIKLQLTLKDNSPLVQIGLFYRTLGHHLKHVIFMYVSVSALKLAHACRQACILNFAYTVKTHFADLGI